MHASQNPPDASFPKMLLWDLLAWRIVFKDVRNGWEILAVDKIKDITDEVLIK